MYIEYHIQVNMYHVNAQGVDERMINVHCYYYYDRWLIGFDAQSTTTEGVKGCQPKTTD